MVYDVLMDCFFNRIAAIASIYVCVFVLYVLEPEQIHLFGTAAATIAALIALIRTDHAAKKCRLCVSNAMMRATYPIRDGVEFDRSSVQRSVAKIKMIMSTWLTSTPFGTLTVTYTNNDAILAIGYGIVILCSTATGAYSVGALILRHQNEVLS